MIYLSVEDVLDLVVLHVGPREALSRPDLLAANGIDVFASAKDGLRLMTDLANGLCDIDAIGLFFAERSRIRGDASGEISYGILAGIE